MWDSKDVIPPIEGSHIFSNGFGPKMSIIGDWSSNIL